MDDLRRVFESKRVGDAGGMTDTITVPHPSPSIETAAIRALMNAVDTLDRAKRETERLSVAGHIDNAIEQIRQAVRGALVQEGETAG